MGLLDETDYPFADADGAALLDLLADTYGTVNQIRALVRDATMRPAEINFVNAALDIWADVLGRAAQEAKLRRLAEVVYQDSQSVGLRELLDRLRASDPVISAGGLDAYSLGLLAANRAFINRVDLRENLHEFADEDGARVLVVRGRSGLGKSHSWHLINFVGQRTDDYCAYRFDLSDWRGPKQGPRQVMQEICGQLHWPVPPVDSSAQPDAVVRILVNAFMGLGRDLRRRTCLVFDGYTDRTADNWGRKLVVGIADAANAGAAGNVCVVLLEVDEPLTENLQRDALPEDLHLGRLVDLPNFFTAAANAANKQVDAAGMAVLIEKVLGPPPHPAEFALTEIGPRAAQVARAAFRGRP